MNLFIAICCDRHIDEFIRVFTTSKKAIHCCKNFIGVNNFDIQELTPSMVSAGWVFYATYGTEGDSVRVEKSTLDPQE